MMGHRYKARNGDEHDCVGSPPHRWRDCMAKNAGRWHYVKKCMSRRIRRENNSHALHTWYEEFQRVDERTTWGGTTKTDSTAGPGNALEEACPEEMEGD